MKKILCIALIIVLLGASVPTTLAKISDNEIASVVQIFEYLKVGNSTIPYASGSGVIIDDSGYILTNYHVVEDVISAPNNYLLDVCVTFSVKEPPVCNVTITSIVKYDNVFDIALLKIEKVENDPKTHEFVPTKKGWFNYLSVDRNAVDEKMGIGDDIQILGFPGVGGNNITYTKGTVSGFENVHLNGKTIPYQIKTDAKVNPGNSGGAALDSNNSYIGIPTAVAGGAGNIGYIISLPVINYFLNIANFNNSKITCDINQYLGVDNSCHCTEGTSWIEKESKCLSFDAGCKANFGSKGRYNANLKQCTCMSGFEMSFSPEAQCIKRNTNTNVPTNVPNIKPSTKSSKDSGVGNNCISGHQFLYELTSISSFVVSSKYFYNAKEDKSCCTAGYEVNHDHGYWICQKSLPKASDIPKNAHLNSKNKYGWSCDSGYKTNYLQKTCFKIKR